jgi:phospholipid/cholesterol/gamma-HCH transport system ATP-binding protein
MTPSGEGPAVQLDHVTKSFGPLKVLDDISLEIPRGRAFGLLGRSGTGKSVTLRHMVGLVKPDRGKVFIEGTDITPLDSHELAPIRRRLGFLFQSSALFDSISVGENVAFPMRRHTDWPDGEIRERAWTKLARVGLEGHYDKMPSELSGGMRKRAGLARAMALDPGILLVDEPSAGLDPITSHEIDELLVELKKNAGTTLVIVTHNIPSARTVADELAFIHDGCLLARGTAADLAKSDHDLVRRFMQSEGAG